MVKALMRPNVIVEREITGQAVVGFTGTRVVMQIDFFVLERTPQSLGEDIVDKTAAAVHADLSACCEDPLGKLGACELAALVGVEYPRLQPKAWWGRSRL